MISEHAVTILVNLSGDTAVLENLATDDDFLKLVFSRLVTQEEPNADGLAMLLANLTKHSSLSKTIDITQNPPEALSTSTSILDQLMDLFVKGQNHSYNKKATFDYLAYVFADLAKHEKIRTYFLSQQKYDKVIPLSKLKVFTEHDSEIRRKGVASTIKNAAFEIDHHPHFLDEDALNILPYVLLPLMGPEEYDVDDTMDMLPDLQLLPPDKKREPDDAIVTTHLETLLLLTTTREGRDLMRRIKVYPIIRECHGGSRDEGVKEACDRLVQVIMRDEEGEGEATEKDMQSKIQELDEDDEIVEV